jgi:hypothetical protein
MTLPALGANYTPRRSWFHSWSSLDLGRTQEDMAQIAELELDHVRIFPLWPLLQPDRTLISTAAVDDVLAVVDTAGECGLRVSVDLLQGHLSSFDYLPAWVTTWHRRNIFTDPAVVAAQQELGRTLARELRGRENLTGMTLGNEIGQFAGSAHPSPHPVDSAQATRWTRDLLQVLDEELPGRRNHHCFDDALWFDDSHPFTPDDAVRLGASTTVHSWVFTGAGAAFGAGDPSLALFGRYLIEVAAAWARLLGVGERSIWLQEIGAPIPWVGGDEAADFAVRSIRSAIAHPDVEAVTWWCSHDVSRGLSDFPELEYSLGLFDSSGRAKPLGEAVGALARELRADAEHPAATAPAGTAADALVVTDVRPDGSNRSVLAPAGDVYRRWAEDALAGTVRPLDLTC